MNEKEQIFQKIQYVISSADQFNDEQFIQVMVGLIKRGGKEAEFQLVKYITDSDIHFQTRGKIIDAAGEIQNVMYLLPLKKVIDIEPNLKLKQSAVLALAKYNDERALNILTSTLTTISNPILAKTVNEKINSIRQSHPVLALTPRFLKGNQDIKAHQVALGMLKKSLTTEEAASFLKYKDSEDELVRKGVFELICSCGDDSLQDRINEVFMERAESCQCLAQPECDELRMLTKNLKEYLERYPVLMDAQCLVLKEIFLKTGDIEVKKILVGIFCQCKEEETINFIKGLYEQEPNLREAIIESSAGNAKAVDFLFEKYQSGKLLKEKVVSSLLRSDQGLRYFLDHFQDFDPDQQEMIVRNLPYSNRPELMNLLESTLKTGHPNLKKYALKIISQNYLYSFKKLLFAPELEEEFFRMETESF